MEALLGNERPSEGFEPISFFLSRSGLMAKGDAFLLTEVPISNNCITNHPQMAQKAHYLSEFLWFRNPGKEQHFWLGGLTYCCKQTVAEAARGRPGISLLRGLSKVSLYRLVWASLQHGSLRAAGLLTWLLKLSTGSIPRARRKLHGLLQL